MPAPQAGPALRSADFERLLSCRPCARSEHFMLHHAPSPPGLSLEELSTGVDPDSHPRVDDRRFALLVPKRHARRAVTRSLIKRQGRLHFSLHLARLAPGDWLLRLRSGYPVALYPSAASAALRGAVRRELQSLFECAIATDAARAGTAVDAAR